MVWGQVAELQRAERHQTVNKTWSTAAIRAKIASSEMGKAMVCQVRLWPPRCDERAGVAQRLAGPFGHGGPIASTILGVDWHAALRPERPTGNPEHHKIEAENKTGKDVG